MQDLPQNPSPSFLSPYQTLKNPPQSPQFQTRSSHLSVHGLINDEVPAGPPVPAPHGLRGGHHVLPHELRRAQQVVLERRVAQLVVERLGDHPAARVKLVGWNTADGEQSDSQTIHHHVRADKKAH